MCFPVCLSAIEDNREGVPTPPTGCPEPMHSLPFEIFIIFFCFVFVSTQINSENMLLGYCGVYLIIAGIAMYSFCMVYVQFLS